MEASAANGDLRLGFHLSRIHPPPASWLPRHLGLQRGLGTLSGRGGGGRRGVVEVALLRPHLGDGPCSCSSGISHQVEERSRQIQCRYMKTDASKYPCKLWCRLHLLRGKMSRVEKRMYILENQTHKCSSCFMGMQVICSILCISCLVSVGMYIHGC